MLTDFGEWIPDYLSAELVDMLSSLDRLIIGLETRDNYRQSLLILADEWSDLTVTLQRENAWALLEPIELLEKSCRMAGKASFDYPQLLVDFFLFITDQLRLILQQRHSAAALESIVPFTRRLLPISRVQRSEDLSQALNAVLSDDQDKNRCDDGEDCELFSTRGFWDGHPVLDTPVMHLSRQASEILDIQSGYWRGRNAFMMPFALKINEHLGEPERDTDLATAVYLHDIGMARIPLPKRNVPISDAVRAKVQEHSLFGAEIALAITQSAACANIVRQHHDRPDAAGYGTGMGSEHIRPGSAILGVLDLFCALAKRESVRDITAIPGLLDEMRKVADTQIDKKVFELFVTVLETEGFVGNITPQATEHYANLVVDQE